jgi:putative ABC transport system permease protein
MAVAAVRYFRAVNPVQLPPGADVSVGIPVVAFAAALGIVAGIASGVFPAWRTSGVEAADMLRAGGRAVAHPARQRLTRAAIAAQAALSVVLLIGAGSVIQSVTRFASAPLGFDPSNVFAQSVVPPAGEFAQPAARARL